MMNVDDIKIKRRDYDPLERPGEMTPRQGSFALIATYIRGAFTEVDMACESKEAVEAAEEHLKRQIFNHFYGDLIREFSELRYQVVMECQRPSPELLKAMESFQGRLCYPKKERKVDV